ncbi:MAG: recombinase family protein [Candidatus Pelethousia sp.]|nr:recombinase family protein [Candidatus Pelethousia sp.]
MKIPYGFAVDNDGKVTIDQAQAQAIQMIFREYLNGSSLGGLARMLENRGIPSPSGNKCLGGPRLISCCPVLSMFHSLLAWNCIPQYNLKKRRAQTKNLIMTEAHSGKPPGTIPRMY